MSRVASAQRVFSVPPSLQTCLQEHIKVCPALANVSPRYFQDSNQLPSTAKILGIVIQKLRKLVLAKSETERLHVYTEVMATLHKLDWLFAIGVIFFCLSVWGIGANVSFKTETLLDRDDISTSIEPSLTVFRLCRMLPTPTPRPSRRRHSPSCKPVCWLPSQNSSVPSLWASR